MWTFLSCWFFSNLAAEEVWMSAMGEVKWWVWRRGGRAALQWFTVSRSMKAATAAHLSYSKNHNSHKHNWNFIECKTTGSKIQFLKGSTSGGEVEFTFSRSCKEDIRSFLPSLFSSCAGFPLSSFSPSRTVGCGETLFFCFFLYFPCWRVPCCPLTLLMHAFSQHPVRENNRRRLV